MPTTLSSRLRTWSSILLLMCSTFASAQPAEEVVHVSVVGDETGAGTLAAPLQSLEQAQVEVRRRIAKGLTGRVRIIVHPGTYELTQTLHLNGNDVPANGSLTISAAKPHTVTFSGGRQVGGWTMTDKNVWTSEKLPDSTKRAQLFLGDQRATRAREPDGGYFRAASTGDDGRTSFGVDDAAWQACSNLTLEQAQQVDVGLLHDWSMSRIRIARLKDKTVHLADRVGAAHDFFRINGFETNPRFFFENARRFVDSEGEFFLDPNENRIYLYAAKINPTTVSVVQPTLPTLLTIRGTSEQLTRRINIEGIVFSHTTCALPANGYAGIQATHFEGRDSAGLPLKDADSVHESDRPCPPAAIEIAYASDCTFRDCHFRHLGGGGIYLNQQTSATKITACTIEDVGANAIMIGETVDPTDLSLVVNSNEVSQCKISRCGQILFGSVGIWIGIASDNKIVGNEISNLPYTGISVGWRWNDNPSGCKNNQISDNYIHHVMQVLSDGGGIYTLGRQPGTHISKNRIHNIPLNMGRAESNGIFMDEGSSGMIIEENVIYEIACSPIRFHKCKSNEVRSNQLFVGDGVNPFTYNNTDKTMVRLNENQVLSGSPESNQPKLK
jgi:hypothetical protein